MCMEDIRVGRKGGAITRLVSVSTADAVIVPYNIKRVALIIAETGGIVCWVQPVNPAGSFVGIPIMAVTPPLVLDVQTHGQIVCQEWHCYASAATTVTVVESILDEA